ncbi:hypothetical protein [Pseudomonas sp. CCI2.4]|uniref:hypothetical protein n=1 Tax=Pseudomonas sp. CCI2.4 TaxID=3048617 RepID=UPI002B23E0A4|nr:hypothetical protein [Pseudomonas sp. CCI2.4]MEB0129738.1 hypothetical protein [Pseudomonas sp. CCI2.4]
MFSEKFSPLIEAYPQQADALRRVANHFAEIEREEGENVLQIVLQPGRLFDISQAGSTAHFARVTTILVESGLFERRVIVRSPGGPAIHEFDNWFDCPLEIYDPVRDINMEVTENDLETLYIVAKNGSN